MSGFNTSHDIMLSTIPTPDFSTEYNIHYRLVNYDEVHRYRADNQPAIDNNDGDFINIVESGSYRFAILRNGTIFVFNITNLNGDVEMNLVTGMTINYLCMWNLDMTEFELHKALPGPVLFGKNTTSNEIKIYSLNFATTHFDYVSNVTITNPVLFNTINDLDIYFATYYNILSYSYIGGKFKNGTTNVPFAYALDAAFALVQDYTNISTSITDYQDFDNAVLSLQHSDHEFHYILTDKHIMAVDDSSKITWVEDLLVEINLAQNPLYLHVSNLFAWSTAGPLGRDYETFTWSFLTPAPTSISVQNLMVNSTSGSDFIRTLKNDPNVSFTSQQIESDMAIKATPDFTDGLEIFGQDNNLNIWQTWFVSSGSVSPSWFDFYMPYRIITYWTGKAFELWYGDSRGLWFSYFNSKDEQVLLVGNSSANKVVSQRCDIFHAQGTRSFQYVVSGYLERNSKDICEVGIIPLYAQPIVGLSGIEPTMFTVDDVHVFLNSNYGGIILRPSQNFQGTGSRMIEFQVKFDADYCPLIDQILGLKFVAINIYYLVWERYTNGTYSQKLFSDGLTAKSALYTYSYTLESAITIQDSHMLDELHVFSAGIEYSPYNLVFTNPNSTILVTDKITNATLHDSEMWFSDPLVLPIEPKYEFWVRYFSTLDNLGLPFELVSTFVNSTQVTTQNVRVLSPNANIVARDFANVTIMNTTVNRYVDGNYINVGLPIASIILSNQYNITVNFYLTRNSITIQYQLPPETAIILRLALGTYHYQATDLNGTELEEHDIEFKATSLPSITLGKRSEPNPVPIPTELNVIIAVVSIGGITGAGIVLATSFKKTKKSEKVPWG